VAGQQTQFKGSTDARWKCASFSRAWLNNVHNCEWYLLEQYANSAALQPSISAGEARVTTHTVLSPSDSRGRWVSQRFPTVASRKSM
jgi:hypothetical protein